MIISKDRKNHSELIKAVELGYTSRYKRCRLLELRLDNKDLNTTAKYFYTMLVLYVDDENDATTATYKELAENFDLSIDEVKTSIEQLKNVDYILDCPIPESDVHLLKVKSILDL